MHGAEDITKAARLLLAEAVAADGAGSPRLPEPEPLVPTMPDVAVPSFAGPGLFPAAGRVPAAPLPAAAPLTDLSGVRAFVGRIRGLDHLHLPPVRFGGMPVAASPSPELSPFFDVDAVRRDFPILRERVHGKPLAWFDNAATTQKPQAVTDAIAHFYAHDNSNIHRGAHTLAARATDAYEDSRRTGADFLGAGSPDEILFVRGCTEGINLVANVLAPGLGRGASTLATRFMPSVQPRTNRI
ncbi:MAG: aminotransferase class V-fold PLP-dependent enzyme [Planctomycetia bacterium]